MHVGLCVLELLFCLISFSRGCLAISFDVFSMKFTLIRGFCSVFWDKTKDLLCKDIIVGHSNAELILGLLRCFDIWHVVCIRVFMCVCLISMHHNCWVFMSYYFCLFYHFRFVLMNSHNERYVVSAMKGVIYFSLVCDIAMQQIKNIIDFNSQRNSDSTVKWHYLEGGVWFCACNCFLHTTRHSKGGV